MCGSGRANVVLIFTVTLSVFHRARRLRGLASFDKPVAQPGSVDHRLLAARFAAHGVHDDPEPDPDFSLGLLATIWTASSGFVSLMESLTVAYGAKETRGFWKKRVLAIAATAVGAVFLLGSFGLLTFGHWAAAIISLRLDTVVNFQVPWELGRWLASLLLMLLGLDLMNYFLPNIRKRWHWLTPGTGFVILMMVAGSAIFNFYLRHFGSYPRFYGTMAGFIILMFWIYIASLILLIGAETDSVIERLRTRERGASSIPAVLHKP